MREKERLGGKAQSESVSARVCVSVLCECLWVGVCIKKNESAGAGQYCGPHSLTALTLRLAAFGCALCTLVVLAVASLVRLFRILGASFDYSNNNNGSGSGSGSGSPPPLHPHPRVVVVVRRHFYAMRLQRGCMQQATTTTMTMRMKTRMRMTKRPRTRAKTTTAPATPTTTPTSSSGSQLAATAVCVGRQVRPHGAAGSATRTKSYTGFYGLRNGYSSPSHSPH